VTSLFGLLTGLTLLDPWMLALVLLVPAAIRLRHRAGAPSAVFAPAKFLGGADDGAAPVSWRVRLRALPIALQVAALLCVVVALARPVRNVALPRKAEGIDILLCLDVSSSMTAKDMDLTRTRLEVARDAAAEFVRGRRDDRIGLVTFARFPDVRCPPTLDHEALARFLAGVSPVTADGPEDATGIGTAVARAAQVLGGAASRSRVVILLSDGEENVAGPQAPAEIAPEHAAQLCKELDIRVYTIAAGVGTVARPGARAPVDTRPVERLAAATGGRFFAARDAGAVAGVYAAIDDLEKARIDEPRYVPEDRFLPFVAAALGLLVAGIVLRSTALDVLP
jgi:Ca-activated chloride channel family protein